MLLLLANCLNFSTALAKSSSNSNRGSSGNNQSNQTGFSISEDQVIGDTLRRKRGYSPSDSVSNYQGGIDFVMEHARSCTFSRNAMIDLSFGGAEAIANQMGKALSVGTTYHSIRESLGGQFAYALEAPSSNNCTFNQTSAEESDMFYINPNEVFKWTPGVITAAFELAKVLDEIGWETPNVDGILFINVSAPGKTIYDRNNECDYHPAENGKLLYKVFVDAGNLRAFDLIDGETGEFNFNTLQTIRECLTGNPRL